MIVLIGLALSTQAANIILIVKIKFEEIIGGQTSALLVNPVFTLITIIHVIITGIPLLVTDGTDLEGKFSFSTL